MTTQQLSKSNFGNLLSDWRKKRRFSQLSFGLYADVSPRHVSFLETGRAKPSRDMVLKLAGCLDMPKVETNRALLLAGFSPAYLSRPAGDADLIPIQKAISIMLDNHMPYPGIAVDRLWNIKAGNLAAMKFLIDAGFTGQSNLVDALCAQTPQQSSIENWEEAIGLVLERLHSELLIAGSDPELEQLMQKLEKHFSRYRTFTAVDLTQAVIPTCFKIGDQIVSVFSTIASFGTVQDVILDDLKVELMFPLDEVSTSYFSDQQD